MTKSNTTPIKDDNKYIAVDFGYPDIDIETLLEEALKRMRWGENRTPTLLEYLRYYRGGDIGEIHIQAAIQTYIDNKIEEALNKQRGMQKITAYIPFEKGGLDED